MPLIIEPPPMLCLYTAEFSDGSRIEQTPEDVSPTTPGRTPYYDITQRIDDVVLFTLNGDLMEGPIEVRPREGSLRVNGREVGEGTPGRVVYVRDRSAELGPNGANMVDYNIGYETPDGRKYMVKICQR